MATPHPYVTLAELKRELPFAAADFGIDDTTDDADGDTDWENLLQELLDREADRIEEWLGTKFELTSTSTKLSRPGHVPKRELPLPERPIDSVTSIKQDGTTLTSGTDYVIVDETHLRLLDDGEIGAWSTDFQDIDVTWQYGHDGAPNPVKAGIIRLVRNALDQIQTDGVSQESEGSFSYTYRTPDSIKAGVFGDVAEHRAPSYHGGMFVA